MDPHPVSIRRAAILAVVLGLLPRAGAQQPTPPKPPSTGREAPAAARGALDEAAARTLLDEALREAKGQSPDCDRVVRSLMRALPVLSPRGYTPPFHEAFVAVQDCAARGRHFQSLLVVSRMLFKAGAGAPHPIVRALAEMGRYDEALKLVADLEPRFADDPEFAAVATFAGCMKAQFTEDWAGCLAAAERTLELARKSGKPGGLLVGQIFRMLSLYFQGRFPDATAALAELEQMAPRLPVLADFRRYLGWGEAYRWFVEEVFPPFVPLGVYHLYGNDAAAPAGALATLKVYNHSGRSLTFKIEVEIPGVTEKMTRTSLVTAGHMHRFLVTPPLKSGFDGLKLRAEKPAQFAYRVVATDPADPKAAPVTYEDAAPVRLIPADHLPLKKTVAKDAQDYTLEYIAAWVTPNARAIDPFLAKAKERAKAKTFAGEQQDTYTQVKALYDELQARGVSYVMDPEVVSDVGHVQRTRLPSEVLSSTNAQCLEGTILFATLIEAIGLRPVIVVVPGHAFVGWYATAQDGAPPGARFFLETTLVGLAPFDAAVKVARERVREEEAAGNFEFGVSFLLDLARMRARGYTPQPEAN